MLQLDCSRMVVLFFFIFLVSTGEECLAADQRKAVKKQKIPPLLVTTDKIVEGNIQPTDEFVGTTSFSRVSQVATDIEGLVRKVNFEVGEKVKRGDQLVLLDSELVDNDIVGTRAAFEQNVIDLENAKRDLKRMDALYKEQTVSEIDHDEYLTRKKRLEKLSIVLESKLNNLRIVKRKKSILAPFSGIILEKKIEVGEWLAKGGKIAVVADDKRMDVLVNISAHMLGHLERGSLAPIKIGSRQLTGTFFTFIPRGDITTRTFTAKFSLQNSDGILEGLEALILLPREAAMNGFIVPRDAVVDKYGKTMVFIVDGNKAKKISVQVGGYYNLQAVITGSGLKKGQQIIVKGSKRVTDDQQITFKR